MVLPVLFHGADYMHRSHAAHTLALAVLLSAATFAQTPNFAGKWAIVPDPSAQGPGGGLGLSAVIKQDATTLTITRTTQMGEVTERLQAGRIGEQEHPELSGQCHRSALEGEMGRRHAECRHDHELRRQSRQLDDGVVARRGGRPRRGVDTPGLPGRRRSRSRRRRIQRKRNRQVRSHSAFTQSA